MLHEPDGLIRLIETLSSLGGKLINELMLATPALVLAIGFFALVSLAMVLMTIIMVTKIVADGGNQEMQ